MGNRGQILLADTGVTLYTHWQAHALDDVLADALDRGRDRWSDPEYLARIIFQEMVGDDESNTGFGIGTEVHGDVRKVLVVEASERGGQDGRVYDVERREAVNETYHDSGHLTFEEWVERHAEESDD